LPVIAERVLSSSGDALREGILGTLCLALEEQKTMIIERLKLGVITVGHGEAARGRSSRRSPLRGTPFCTRPW